MRVLALGLLLAVAGTSARFEEWNVEPAAGIRAFRRDLMALNAPEVVEPARPVGGEETRKEKPNFWDIGEEGVRRGGERFINDFPHSYRAHYNTAAVGEDKKRCGSE